MSYKTPYQSVEDGDEGQQLLKEFAIERKQNLNTTPKKVLNQWSLMSVGVAVIVVTVLIIATAKPRQTSVYIREKTDIAVKSTGHKVLEAIRTRYAKLSNEEHKKLFSTFKSFHRKKYETVSEENQRFQNFKSFLEEVDMRNEEEVDNDGHAVHGITKFADLSPEEFRERFLTYKPASTSVKSSKWNKGVHIMGNSANSILKDKKFSEISSVDWTGIYTNSVNDQGYCGSCWAFSVVEQVESDAIRANILNISQPLSVQQVVSCDSVDLGCSGGNTETAYQYIAAAGGLVSAKDYPYQSFLGQTGLCMKTNNRFTSLVTVSGYQTISGGNHNGNVESAMMSYVSSTGPLSICLDASLWATYTGGVISRCGHAINHCVQLVGIQVEKNYWKIRNSWGRDWGDSGFIYLQTGKNMCGITTDPTFAVVEKV